MTGRIGTIPQLNRVPFGSTTRFRCRQPDVVIQRRQRTLFVHAAISVGTKGAVKDAGAFTVQGTVRVRNEDRWDLKVAVPSILD